MFVSLAKNEDKVMRDKKDLVKKTSEWYSFLLPVVPSYYNHIESQIQSKRERKTNGVLKD